MMRRISALFLCLTVALWAGHAAAQESDFQAWNALAVSGPAADDSRFLLWFDGHARFSEDASRLGVSIIRPGIGWRVKPGLDLWAGYARVVSRADGRENIEEDRIWQQATFNLPAGPLGTIGMRTRLEQRFREAGDETGWRFRQFARWSRRLEGTDFSIVAWDELFINLNNADGVQTDGFDQNRLFVGAAWHVAPSVRFEAGYLNNILNPPGGNDPVNHNLSLSLFLSL